MKKRYIVLILLVLVLLSAAAGAVWFFTSHVIVEGQAYARNTQSLDLRGSGITAQQYDEICSKLPQCDVRWDVPFQGSYYAQDTASITVTTLTEEDVAALDYLTALETVHAEGCTDYTQLEQLAQRRPEVAVLYTVSLNGEAYSQDTRELTLTGIGQEEIELVQYLPQLQSVTLAGSETPETLLSLQEVCRERGIGCYVVIGGEPYDESVTELTLTNAADADVALLRHLPQLKKVHLVTPAAAGETLVQLRQDRPDMTVTWEQEIAGMMLTDDVTEVDISDIQVEDLDAIAKAMTYFPDAEKLVMCRCGVDYEVMSQFREEHRSEYKVVWAIRFYTLYVRTDETVFAPVKYDWDEDMTLYNEHFYNLRYCEDLVCVDVGHYEVADIDWVAFMPHLKYLVLAHCPVRDITPISNCKELLFLELDHTYVRDYSPLLGCTALEDLNLGLTWGDWEPVAQMTWLKNLWWKEYDSSARDAIRAALPDTNCQFALSQTVSGGWRQLQNYYDMRDMMEMPYLT